MKHREPYNIRTFLIVYNACQVGISAYIFYWLLQGGWIIGDYSFVCQPVDYSDSREAKIMTHVAYVYYLSKFSEFIDTFAFVARKKFSHVSTLHVIHHGVMPRTVRQKILDGALKWKGPREGLTLQRFFKKSRYFSLLREKLPLMLMPSHLTTTTLLPVRMSLATMEESLPMRWPRPSTTIAFGDIPGIFSCRSESSNKSLVP